MASQQESFEWELSKENVQPLSGGRRIANLTAALQPQADQASRLREEKQKYEIELRTYQGDDPISVWYKYIIWVEQNYPSGGGANNKSQLLEQCVSKFQNDERYKNDPRYIEIWIKFANICNDANQIFTFMFNNGIGSSLADFYIAWSSELETLGNVKRADAIYTKGIELFAQPRDVLVKRHNDFQARVAARMASGDLSVDGPAHQDPSSENRVTLGGLKGHGKSKKVGSVRQTTSKSSALGPLHGADGTSNVKGPGFTIYQEQENRPSNLPPQTGEWAKVPIQAEINRENQLKPGKWTDAKVRQRSSGLGASVTPVATAPAFKVHTDEDVGLSTVTPRKLPPAVNLVLSARKPDKPKDPLQNLVCKTESGATTMPMYCKHLIYMGMKEFSFEELRAAVVQKKEEDERKKRLEDERLQVERDLLMQREQLARVMEEKMRIEEEVQRIRVSKVPPAATETFGNVPGNSIPAFRVDSPALVEQHMAKPSDALGNSSEPKFSFTQPGQHNEETPMETNFAAPAPVKHGLIKPGIATPDDKTINLLSTSGFTSSGGGSIQATPDDTSDLFKSVPNRPNSMAWGIAAPSPTTNTKDALQCVLGMFNQTIGVDNADLGFDDKSTDQEEPFTNPLSYEPSPAFNVFVDNKSLNEKSPQPCAIYDENTKPKSMANKTPFTIFEDKDIGALSDKSSAAKPFTVYDENADSSKASRFTGPPMSQINRDRRGLTEHRDFLESPSASERAPCPITEQSIIMEDGPLHEEGDVDMDDEPTLASGQYKTLLQDKNLEDMTFAPEFSSTQNFSKMARLVSTPFNPSGELPAMAIPPVSIIHGDEQDNYAAGKSVMASRYALGETMASETTNVKDSTVAPGNSSKAPAQEVTPEHLEETDPGFGPKRVSNLSPITECSDEDHKLGMSSMVSIKPDHGESQLAGNRTTSAMETNTAPNTTSTTAPSSHVTPQSDKKNLMNHTCHEIDVSCYQHDETQDLLSQSVMVNPYSDPFDNDLIAEFLTNVERPIELYPNYHLVTDVMPLIRSKRSVCLGKDEYHILDRIGEGAYACVYAVEKVGSSQKKKLVMKVQKPPCPWEFYVTCELHRRIMGSPVTSSFMTIDDAYFFDDGSCLMNELYTHGNLLDIVNAVRGEKAHLPEPQIVLLCIELLRILETMMAVDFIHGDIKPDNFLFRGFPSMNDGPAQLLKGNTQCLKLIDFGRGIDMRMFPEGTTFGVTVDTSGFQCIEMKTNRPWTYQTDMFGLVGTMHVLIFNEYMNVKMHNGRWRSSLKFRRWFTSSAVVTKIFDEFLNVPSCTSLPNVSQLRKELEEVFVNGCGRNYQQGLENVKQFRK